MSYLGALRLHFAGRFQANISTVNNDPTHFDNVTFQPSYQLMQTATMPNGWFNPQGDAAFRLLGCAVTSAWTAAGGVGPRDPILACIIADSDGAVPAKLVDLDPEQQLVSQIYGLEVRIADGNGNTLVRGAYVPAPFADIWDRATGGSGGDIGAGATYQSVLEDVAWGDISASPFLQTLQTACAASGRLSIKFNVDGLNMDYTSPHFMCGRIVGTIGAAEVGEPRHLVIGRHLMATAAAGGNFFTPAGGINYFPARIDAGTSTLFLDLGNALTTKVPGGPMNNVGDLKIGVDYPLAAQSGPPGSAVPLGVVPAIGTYGYADDPNWYSRTAGVVALSVDPAQAIAAAASPLVVIGKKGIDIAESPQGAYLRADNFVYRMSPGDAIAIPIYATRWGRPLGGAAVTFTADPSQLQGGQGVPSVAIPPEALRFGLAAVTDADGIATLHVGAGDPGTPRWNGTDYGIDGQVYGIRPSFTDPGLAAGPVNQWDFVSFLLWSGFTVPDQVTWSDVQPILQQYANLYPVMLRFLDLADPAALQANLPLLELAFSLPITDPNTMPVTRDLSPNKRAAILAWLAKPLAGSEVVSARLAAAPRAITVSRDGAPPKGGKAAAAARRLVLQGPQGAQS